jgi:adenylosuccinate lyase
MGHVWSDANRFQKWLDVELAAADTLAEAGEVPKDAAAVLRVPAPRSTSHASTPKPAKHDVIASTMAVGESVGIRAARWLHYGMTSNDVVDTAQALLVRDASHIIERDLVILGEVLDVRAHEFQHTPQIGHLTAFTPNPSPLASRSPTGSPKNQRNIARFPRSRSRHGFRQDLRRSRQRFASRHRRRGEDLQAAGLQSHARGVARIQRDRHAHYLSALA